ncbi:MAG: site-2 protease family protein [Phycisphaeraceae bacterium]|nr:site-2 protease family protein [Phycisphaeraceae bacterium]
MFIEQALNPDGQLFYFGWILTVVLSIILHELSHGLAAIRLGDDTPIYRGHMTINPLVHMGPWSLVCLFLFGIAWGQMPVDPTRLRGKYAEALVALAGPATNLLLSLVALTILGLWLRHSPGAHTLKMLNAQNLLLIFGWANLALCLFNLLPVPPLDGSHVAANLSRGYQRLASDPAHQGLWILAFAAAFFIFGSVLFSLADRWSHAYLRLLLS